MSNNNTKREKKVEEYDFYHVETGKRFTIQKQLGRKMKLLSNKRYFSPHQANKSTRKSRLITRQRISKSLNFETGRDDRFKTPGTSGIDEFSRSSKIMRALNFNSCPGNNSKRKSVTKVLNFDISPSQKNLQSPQSNFSTSSPIESIHLSISSTDSHATSIDENQNRTPSQSKKSAKKSLDYLTPQSNKSLTSPKVNISPVLRTELREKIQNLVEANETPHLHSAKRNLLKSALPNNLINTSRNLYYDFEKECSDSSASPSTPENTSKPIPESMSAIKKSHRKERLSKRFEGKSVNEGAGLMDDDDENDGMRLLEPEDQTTSPPIMQHLTPNNRISNELLDDKDNVNYEDNMSETGSLFSYNQDKENVEGELELEQDLLDLDKELEVIHKSVSKSPVKSEQIFVETPKREKLAMKVSKVNISSPPKLFPGSNDIIPISNSTPLVSKKNFIIRTPENDISVIPDIISSSIKKSHKKVKEENRKRLIPKTLQTALLNSSRDRFRLKIDANEEENPDDRPTTPENLNSSRLLLPQFDSVKKSHKKEKLCKKLHGFARRSMILDADHMSSSMRSNYSDVSMSLKNLLDESTNSEPDSNAVQQKRDSFLEAEPNTSTNEHSSSPSKKMKTPEGEIVNQQSMKNNDDFQIFTPLRKRRTHLVPADEPVVGSNTSIIGTVDDSFVTPVKGKKLPPVRVAEDITPEDRLRTTELVKNIEHSIKKSHRKDKLKAKQTKNCLSRSLCSSFIEVPTQNEMDDPQPSTSRASNEETSITTPPNCLKTKSYLHHLENSSIKKSYKLEKEKRESITDVYKSADNICTTPDWYQLRELIKNKEDSSLSDDGSIFSEEDKISFLRTEASINASQDNLQEDDTNLRENTETTDPVLNNEDKISNLDQSNEGSIFNDSERLQDMDEFM